MKFKYPALEQFPGEYFEQFNGSKKLWEYALMLKSLHENILTA